MSILGHPCLRSGQTLVYPEAYLCHECMLHRHSLSPFLTYGPFFIFTLAQTITWATLYGLYFFDQSRLYRKRGAWFGRPFSSSTLLIGRTERKPRFQRPLT